MPFDILIAVRPRNRRIEANQAEAVAEGGARPPSVDHDGLVMKVEPASSNG